MNSQLRNGYLYKNKIKIFLISLIDLILGLLFPQKVKPFKNDSIKKILIIKPDHMGDVLLSTSIYPILKEVFPSCKLDIIIGKWSKDILKNNPYINKCLEYNNFNLNRSKESKMRKVLEHIVSFISAVRRLRKEKYDLCLILRAYGNNGILLAKIGGCKYIVGHGTGGFGPLLDKVATWNEGIHETEHFLEVLRETCDYKIEKDYLKYQIFYDKNDELFVNSILNRYNIEEQNFVVIHPGTGNPVRKISDEKWRAIIKDLTLKGNKIVLTGSNTERDLAKNIIESSDNIIHLTGIFSINQLACFFKKSKLIITLETLAAHIGASTGISTIAIYSGTSDTNQWRPNGYNVKVVKRSIACSPCFKGNGCETMKCMDIDVKDVLMLL